MLKQKKDTLEEPYKYVTVDGRSEQNGNFRVEPPGLFRGRGEHPKMGMLKRRIYPRDVTINIGHGEPVPKHPYPDQTCARPPTLPPASSGASPHECAAESHARRARVS